MTESPTLHLAFNAEPPAACRGGAVAVGNFDGVHLGHAALIKMLCTQAREVGGPAVVLSFDPHPLLLLDPERFQPLLTLPADRVSLLRRHGVDFVVLLQTSPELLQLSPQQFFQRILCGGFGARAIVEGFNFRFGRDRAGDNETLAQLCRSAGICFTMVPPLEHDGTPVSSSRVRDTLLAGEVGEAAEVLGRPYRLRGLVAPGAHRGRSLGFPTANLTQIETLIPGDGVYAVRALIDEKLWPAAANVGPNPTFGEQARKVEVHVLDFDGDLYGRNLGVDFVARLRATRPFAGAVELKEQLNADVRQARKLLSCDPGA